jgi:IS4 transposase
VLFLRLNLGCMNILRQIHDGDSGSGHVVHVKKVKVHTLLDLRGWIPAFIHMSDGKIHEVNVLDILAVEAGAFYVMDRGYLDFARLYKMHQAGAFFVTRAKRGMDARRVYSTPTDRDTGVICDQRIALNGFYISKDYPEYLRRIRFKDPESGKTLVFQTNNTTLPALTIASFYKKRWQVELFFMWTRSVGFRENSYFMCLAARCRNHGNTAQL